MNKQLKDKKDHEVKLRDDLKRDGNKLVDLQNRLASTTAEMERQREAINDHNRQYYESKKNKDQAQSLRK